MPFKPIILTLAFALLCPIFSIAQFSIGARSAGLAQTGVTLSDVWSSGNNQAASLDIKSTEIGLSAENKFGFTDLNKLVLASIIPHKKFTSCLLIIRKGNATFNHIILGYAVAKQIYSKHALAIQFNYNRNQFNIPINPNPGGLNATICSYSKLSDIFSLGIQLVNFLGTTLNSKTTNNNYSFFRIGGKYQPNIHVAILCEYEKRIDLPASIMLGCELQPHPLLQLRIGTNNGWSNFSFGLGLKLGQLQIDTSFSSHFVLGPNTSISICYQSKTK